MLILLPNLLGPDLKAKEWLAPCISEVVATLDGVIAESEKGARRYLSQFETKKGTRNTPVALFPKKIQRDDLAFLLEPVLAGETWGVVSDAGLPCLADPGSSLVAYARRERVDVQAFPGPCSITQALMLSGLFAQRFAFAGYLGRERDTALRSLEERSKKEREVEVFIQAPYRNDETLQACLSSLSSSTRFCVAWDLTLESQGVMEGKISWWKKQNLPKLNKRFATFLLLAQAS